MKRAAWSVALLALAACPGESSKPTPIVPGPAGSGSAVATLPDASDEALQEERLAAIQKAMNELDEAAQGCWAAAATERFDIEGDVVMQVDIGKGTASVMVATNTTRNDKLGSCMTALLTNYPWAPPLAGQAIQLPFKFRAPADGQNVIDRRLVPTNGQGKVSIAVLLDEANSGNDDASMFELAVQAGGTTGMRVAQRDELWYFLGPATLADAGAKGTQPVARGDMAFVPKGGARELVASSGDVHAVLVMVPGGREGAARAGALPTPELGSVRRTPVGPQILKASAAKTYGPATIYAEPALTSSKQLAASVLALPKGGSVPVHVHATETEMLYILAGSGTMTVAGVQIAVTPTSVVQIPPNTKHAFTAAEDVRAVQIYTPAGPEQRFKAPRP